MSPDELPANHKQAITTFISGTKADPDFIKQCFWELKAEFDSYGKKISRWGVLALTAICLFELVNRRLMGEFSLAGITVTRLSFLLYIVPPVVAVSLLNLATLSYEQNIYMRLLKEFASQWLPALSESNIINVLLAQQGTIGGFIPKSFMKKRVKFSTGVSLFIQVALVPAFLVAFEGYAYSQLFMHAGSNKLAAIISLIAGFIPLIPATVLLIDPGTYGSGS